MKIEYKKRKEYDISKKVDEDLMCDKAGQICDNLEELTDDERRFVEGCDQFISARSSPAIMIQILPPSFFRLDESPALKKYLTEHPENTEKVMTFLGWVKQIKESEDRYFCDGDAGRHYNPFGGACVEDATYTINTLDGLYGQRLTELSPDSQLLEIITNEAVSTLKDLWFVVNAGSSGVSKERAREILRFNPSLTKPHTISTPEAITGEENTTRKIRSYKNLLK